MGRGWVKLSVDNPDEIHSPAPHGGEEPMPEMPESTAASPIVIDLGKAKRKRIKQLERGEGPLAEEVRQAVEQVGAGLGAEADGKVLVPVVLLYRRKPRRRRFPFNLKL